MAKTELLAPAGDMDCFYAAVSAGADAVYLGGEEYGARAYASNFSKEELCEAICYAHLFGVKVYLTVNTLVKERELDGLCAFLMPFYEAGLDGVIVQDFGALKVIKENFPELELHGSTQMCVTGKYGAELLKKFGVSRVVPARELSLDELIRLKEATGLEIETFIHGAMCYGYSGQCLFSSFLGGRSGNRGRCAGPCRLPYTVFGQKEVYPLSLKDMCTLPILSELIDAGMDSFKIEGRMKNPYYVAGVTAVYRKYIDLYECAKSRGLSYEVAPADLKLLKSLYVRTDLMSGYYHRHNGQELVTLHKPGYETGNEEQFLEIRQKYLDSPKKLSVFCELQCKIGEKMTLAVKSETGVCVSVRGENPVQMAQKRPVTKEDIQKQLGKTGNTPFHFTNISVIMDEDIFIPLKEINELRRNALEQLKKRLTESNKRLTVSNLQKTKPSKKAAKTKEVSSYCEDITSHTRYRFRILTVTKEQLAQVVCFAEKLSWQEQPCPFISGVGIHFTLLEEPDFLKECLIRLKALHISCHFCMPQVFRRRAAAYCDRFLTPEYLADFDGFYCGSLDALGYIRNRLEAAGLFTADKELTADYSLYTCNHEAASFLKEFQISALTASYELNRYEWNEFLKQHDSAIRTEYLVYGHIPFMQSAGCIKKTFDRCNHTNEMTCLTDRMGKKLPVINFCQICENTIYNSVPLSLQKEMEQINCDDYRIAFTVENASRTKEVLESFFYSVPMTGQEFTKGHYKKGIE